MKVFKQENKLTGGYLLIKEARGFGDTIDEAKEKAIAELNAAEDEEIQFEVIDTPKKKTLGLFGGRQAQVRVFVEIPDEKPKQRKKNSQKPVKAEQKPSAEKAQPAEAKPQKSEKPAEKTAPKAEEKAAPQSSEETESKEAKEKKQPNKKYDLSEGYGELKDAGDVPADTKAGKAVAYIRTVLSHLGCSEITIKVAEKENAALIELDGEGLGTIIGHRGETLDAIQYLTGLAANNGGGYYRVAINIGNYREKREEALIALAKRVSAQVLKTGKNRSLEPMNPYERRIIHTTVQGIEGVASNSFGEGAARRVVISLEGGDPRPPKREGSRRGSRSNRRPVQKSTPAAPSREPKKDSDTPLYGKIN